VQKNQEDWLKSTIFKNRQKCDVIRQRVHHIRTSWVNMRKKCHLQICTFLYICFFWKSDCTIAHFVALLKSALAQMLFWNKLMCKIVQKSAKKLQFQNHTFFTLKKRRSHIFNYLFNSFECHITIVCIWFGYMSDWSNFYLLTRELLSIQFMVFLFTDKHLLYCNIYILLFGI